MDWLLRFGLTAGIFWAVWYSFRRLGFSVWRAWSFSFLLVVGVIAVCQYWIWPALS